MAQEQLTELEASQRRVMELEREVAELRKAKASLRSLETQVLHAQKLESLGLFASGVAHDFNNLLSGVLGNAGLVSMQLADDSPLVPLVEEIEQAAEHASGVVDQMMTYAGKVEVEVETVMVHDLLREMKSLLRSSISKKAELCFHLAEDLPAVRGNSGQLRQTVMNLVLNASDALDGEPGSITVSTDFVDADRSYLAAAYLAEDLPEGRYVVLEVTDSGHGLDAQTRERLFDPFFTTKGSGRGLGMASVLGIVHQHRGAIKVYSEPGQGSSFRIHFPATREESAESREDDESTSTVFGGTILVVDDDPTVRRMAMNVLKSFGYDVLEACDGVEALERFDERDGELAGVLLDMTMPRLDGVETFRELRRRQADLAVLLSSGFNSQQTRVDELIAATGNGRAGFLRKPYRPVVLIEKLHELLDEG